MTTHAITGRRRARRNGGEAAPLALSLLDIVSAGFGAAVFLFVIFAALPLGEPRPGGGGGSNFIDLRLEWDLPRVGGVDAPALNLVEKLNELSIIYDDWRRHTHMFDDRDKVKHALRTDAYAELPGTLKIDRSEIDSPARELWKSRTKELGDFLIPWLDAVCSNLRQCENSFPDFLEETSEFEFHQLCPIFDIDYRFAQKVGNSCGEPRSICGEEEFAAYTSGCYADVANIAIEKVYDNVEATDQRLRELPFTRPLASLSESSVNDDGPAAARFVDPKLSLQIIYRPLQGDRRVIDLTESGYIALETDALIHKYTPWEAAFVTGYDFYGNYFPVLPDEGDAERVLAARILNPDPGEWSFRAKILDRDGMGEEFRDRGLGAALTCTGGEAETEVIPLYPFENDIEIGICRIPGLP